MIEEYTPPTPRRIRSFVRREGRITPAQERALRELWPLYGVDRGEHAVDTARLFGRKAATVMEIGFGNGAALVELAASEPACNFLGVEVYRPGVGRLLRALRQHGLTNVRIFCDDAFEVLSRRIAKRSLAKLLIFFPDPWHKKRHHKRRLIQPEFVRVATDRLEVGGTLHVATDWEDYAECTLNVLQSEERLRNLAGKHRYVPRPPYRPLTKFERRGRLLGHRVWDLLFAREY